MSSKKDWTEGLPELFEGYTESEPAGLWSAVRAGVGAGRRRVAAWWYGGALLAAAAVVALVILFRPAADPSVIQVGSEEMVAAVSDPIPSSATSAAPDATVPDTREPQSVSGGGNTAEIPPKVGESVETTAKNGEIPPEEPDPWKQTTVPLERRQPAPSRERQTRRRQPIRIMAGISGGLMAQNVSQSGQQAAHVASMMGSAPAIQTKSITGGTTTFDPSIINRNKPGTTECNHRQSARFAAGIKVNFLPHWGVESGIVGTTLNSSWGTISGNSMKNVEQEMHYIGIPLYLHFNALDWNGLSLYLAAGPMYEFTNETSEIYSTRLNGKLLSSATDNHLQKDHRWSVNAAAGLQLEFMENNAIYIQPGLSYHFRRRNVAGLDIQNYYTARPASFNLTIGYRLLLF